MSACAGKPELNAVQPCCWASAWAVWPMCMFTLSAAQGLVLGYPQTSMSDYGKTRRHHDPVQPALSHPLRDGSFASSIQFRVVFFLLITKWLLCKESAPCMRGLKKLQSSIFCTINVCPASAGVKENQTNLGDES